MHAIIGQRAGKARVASGQGTSSENTHASRAKCQEDICITGSNNATSSNRHACDGAQQIEMLQRRGVSTIKWDICSFQCTRRAYSYAQESSNRKLPVATLGVRRICPRLGTPSYATENKTKKTQKHHSVLLSFHSSSKETMSSNLSNGPIHQHCHVRDRRCHQPQQGPTCRSRGLGLRRRRLLL